MLNVDIRIVTLQGGDDVGACQNIRKLVFQDEQGIAAALDFDGKDKKTDTWHKLAMVDGAAAGTARIVMLGDGHAKIGRLAVLPDFRGHGLGRMIMQDIMGDLSARQVVKAELSSQIAVQKLYESLGFRVDGAVYEEAGLPHIKMVWSA